MQRRLPGLASSAFYSAVAGAGLVEGDAIGTSLVRVIFGRAAANAPSMAVIACLGHATTFRGTARRRFPCGHGCGECGEESVKTGGEAK